jgi:pyruvate dehydrogenase E1 component beta subunit
MSRTGAQHAHDALSAFLTRDSAVLVGENVGRGGGWGGSTAGLVDRFADQVIDTPVGDRSVVGLALGLALAGRPVCAELSSTRSLLAAASVLTDAARATRSEFRPALVLRVPFAQGLGPVVEPPVGDLLCRLAGIGVHVARAETVRGLLSATLGAGVHVVLESADDLDRRAPAHDVTPGEALVLREGAHVTLVAWGSGVRAALDAAEQLAADGVEATVLDAVTLSSLDASIGAHVRRTGRIVAVGPRGSSFVDRVLAHALDTAFLYLESPPGDCHADVAAVVKAARHSVHY